MDLSIIIPARQEMFLAKTIENILENIEADTEIIAICDGNWPDPPVPDHPRLRVVHHSVPIGQRAATNMGARISEAKFIMKADAHCAFGKGFDRILMEDCQPDWTMIPMMWNLHAFDWVCKTCGDRTYQGKVPDECKKCGKSEGFEMDVIWKPRVIKSQSLGDLIMKCNLSIGKSIKGVRKLNVKAILLKPCLLLVRVCLCIVKDSGRLRVWMRRMVRGVSSELRLHVSLGCPVAS